MGTFRRFASLKAAGPHSYQSTGLVECIRRYGEWENCSRFWGAEDSFPSSSSGRRSSTDAAAMISICRVGRVLGFVIKLGESSWESVPRMKMMISGETEDEDKP